MMILENLLKIRRNQIDQAAWVLARAFEQDPLHVAYFPDASTRLEQNFHLMKHTLRYTMMHGEVFITSSDLEGVALWHLVDPKEELQDKPKSIFMSWLTFRLAINIGDAIKRVGRYYGYTFDTHYELVTSPHWYFFILGVDPAYQGKGYGSSLIKPMLKRIDKEKLQCYLDTNNEDNVGIYRHYGFNVIKKYEIPDANVMNWSMLRDNP